MDRWTLEGLVRHGQDELAALSRALGYGAGSVGWRRREG
jgi:hypothetical protein